MEKAFLEFLVSPETHQKLEIKCTRLCNQNGKIYKTINGVPILLSENTCAAWHRELIEVILWEHPEIIEEIYKEIPNTDDYSKVYIRHIERVLKDKNGIKAALERYSLQDTQKWVVRGKKKISINQRIEFIKFAKKSVGKKRTESKINAKGIFAVYPYFGKAANENNPKNIVELGTGAGGGTAAVALEMQKGTRLFTIDIGFKCLSNAVGIAKYQKKRIVPVCANFWHLPFADCCVDAVCTYNGLDESRENGQTIAEIARILKVGGRFVAVSRKNSFMRQARVLEHFGFTENETVELMKKCRLYGDTESFDEICEKNGLTLKERKEFEKNNNLISVLSVFEKTVDKLKYV